MDRTNALPSYEAQPLNPHSSRNAVENAEHRNSLYEESRSSSSLFAFTTQSRDAEGRGQAAPTYAPIDGQQQKQLEICHQGHQGQNTPSQHNDYVQRLWLWEAVSIAVAALALGAIVTILVLRKDRSLPKWPSAITINALIAVFTAVFKACLMMPIAESIGQLKWLWYQKPRSLRHMEQWDLASRGPWGSLLLIFLLKSWDLAVIGAILTIAAMAVDPFTQQIVHFYSCPTMVRGELATVPFSNNYTSGFKNTPYGAPDPDPQSQLAIYAGLLDPPANASSVLNFECRTGNCTFPSTLDGASFLSLALETRCADISNDISISVNVSNYKDAYNKTHVSTTTNVTLFHYDIYLHNSSTIAMKSQLRTSVESPSSFLFKIAFLMTSDATELQHTQAFECEFYPVVNTYSAKLTNGVLFEQVLSSQRMNIWSTDFMIHWAMLLVNKTVRADKWHECTSSEKQSEEHNFPIHDGMARLDPYYETHGIPDYMVDDVLWWPQDCVYWIGYEPTEGLAHSLDQFIGNESLEYDLWTHRAKGNLWSVNLWHNGSATVETVQSAMDGLSRSITARWRQGDGVSHNVGPVVGTVWDNQTCVRVNWGWIALPGGLLLLTIVFLILTIVRTRSNQAHVWKSSIFAMLFSGFDNEMRQATGPVVGLKEMKAVADRATVRLEYTKDGFRLVGQT